MEYVNTVQYAVSICLQALLLVLILRSYSNTYVVLFLYSAVYLITSAVEVFVSRSQGRRSPAYGNLYWFDEILLDALLFVMVITLTFRAASESPIRAGVVKILLVGLVVAVVLPFLFGNQPVVMRNGINRLSPRFFTRASQILNFSGAILNMALWTALLGSRTRDHRRLLVCAGVGIAVTGQALYYGIRLLSASDVVRIFADFVNIITHIAGIAIWCIAFKPAKKPEAIAH